MMSKCGVYNVHTNRNSLSTVTYPTVSKRDVNITHTNRNCLATVPYYFNIFTAHDDDDDEMANIIIRDERGV